MYHQQLSYYITQFVEKDCKLSYTVIKGLLKYWPIRNSTKEVMCLGELEEILEATQPAEFQKCTVPLFRQIAGCLNNSHFQKIVLGMAVNRGCYIGQSQSLNISMGQVNSEKLTSLHFHAWSKVWKAQATPKCKLFAWLVLHGRILTVESLAILKLYLQRWVGEEIVDAQAM
ncbi:hypothetical protein VPH35_098591 [Triticum aestivum]|uniref:Serine/threonine protein phosphatase 2A 59 kDa regulatory subunit B' eta isoform n=1 Tax=Aegilops tauschii TaxID=37682 RepID=N1QZB9_AEGTA